MKLSFDETVFSRILFAFEFVRSYISIYLLKSVGIQGCRTISITKYVNFKKICGKELQAICDYSFIGDLLAVYIVNFASFFI